MNIKTAFDVARPKHVAKIMGDQDVHGWITAAVLRARAGLEGQATFGNLDSTFPFTRCIRQGSVEAPRLWLNMALQILVVVELEWMRKKMGLRIDRQQGGIMHFAALCERAIVGSYLTQRRTWSR